MLGNMSWTKKKPTPFCADTWFDSIWQKPGFEEITELFSPEEVQALLPKGWSVIKNHVDREVAKPTLVKNPETQMLVFSLLKKGNLICNLVNGRKNSIARHLEFFTSLTEKQDLLALEETLLPLFEKAAEKSKKRKSEIAEEAEAEKRKEAEAKRAAEQAIRA